MKVLQINSHFNQSGAGKIVASIHNYLKNKGFDSKVAYGRGNKILDPDVYFISDNISIYISFFISKFLGVNGFSSWFNTHRLINMIKKNKPDIIHLHGLHGYYINFTILFNYINKEKVPVLWTFHDYHAFSGNCGYSKDCTKWMNGCGRCPYLHEYPSTLFFDFTHQMWKRKRELFTKTPNKVIVSPSEWMTKNAQESFFSKYRCITINNGIDTDKTFYPRDKASCRDKFGFKIDDKIALGIAFGFDNPRKGVEFMIKLAKDHFNDGIILILIGWNSKNNHLIDDCENIRTISFTNNQEELAEYYSLADVFLLPSLEENYATVTLEALACGTPVVGFDVGGIPEQIELGNGVVVQKGNQEDFNKAVMNVINKEVYLKTKESITNTTREKNSIISMASRYEKEYIRLINGDY